MTGQGGAGSRAQKARLPDVLIRPAFQADAAATRRLLIETWHDTYDPLLGPEKVAEITNRWHTVAALSRQIDSPRSSFLVAEHANEVIGHAFANEQKGILILSRLYVLPAYQHRGVGSRLLTVLIERHPRVRKVRLAVEAENGDAIGFYRRHGFNLVGEMDDTEAGVRFVRMEKTLG